jgi:hypothetical protein
VTSVTYDLWAQTLLYLAMYYKWSTENNPFVAVVDIQDANSLPVLCTYYTIYSNCLTAILLGKLFVAVVELTTGDFPVKGSKDTIL